MKVSDENKPWVKYVKKGQLDLAYASFFENSLFYRITRFISLRFLIAKLGHWAIKTGEGKCKPCFDDSKVDLSKEFILFWKNPDIVGRYLITSILKNVYFSKTMPLRSIIWFGHWLCFQGEYTSGFKLFRYALGNIINHTPRSRLHGELLSLIAGHVFNRGNFKAADDYYTNANEILREQEDLFFTIFNIGSWARIGLYTGNLKKLKMTLSHYDGLNPSSPDERQGLRILVYNAYLYYLEGNLKTGRLFLKAAETCFSSSGSHLDRSIYLHLRSLIAIIHNSVPEAKEYLTQAKKELKKFGKYEYYSHLLATIENYLRGEQITQHRHYNSKKYRNISALLSTLNKGKMSKEETSFQGIDGWYKDFFDSSLHVFGELEKLSLNGLKKIIAGITHSKSISSEKIKTPTLSPSFSADAEGNWSVYTFNLTNKGDEFIIKCRSPFKAWRNPEITSAIESSLKALQRINWSFKLQKDAADKSHALEFGKLAKSTAHDLRSPLASLNVVMERMSIPDPNLRQASRSSLNRIGDIANNLMSITKRSHEKHQGREQNLYLASGLIDALVSEKRIEYINKKNILIEFDFKNSSFNQFIRVNDVRLKNILSNIVNNSVEAIEEKGNINIGLLYGPLKETIEIRIKDNGKGIKKSLLDKVFDEGFSHGKENGHGIGLFEAKKIIDSWEGSIEIDSSLGEGTTVKIFLPVENYPTWFAPTLNFVNFSKVCVLDDDSSIHEAWKTRIAANITVKHFYSAQSFEFHMDSNPDKGETLYLIDSELYGESISGQALIKKYSIQKNSILVTGRFEEQKIIEEVKELGIKLLPKFLVPVIPIEYARPEQIKYDACVVEDDDTLREMLEHSLKTKFPYKSLKFSKFPNELLEISSNIKEKSVIISDFSFGEGKINGVEMIKYLKAYKNGIISCISSGLESEDLKKEDEENIVDYFIPKDHESIIDLLEQNLS